MVKLLVIILPALFITALSAYAGPLITFPPMMFTVLF